MKCVRTNGKCRYEQTFQHELIYRAQNKEYCQWNWYNFIDV